MAATPITTAELADALDTTPRTLRKFLRATTPVDSQPGKGSRYSLPGDARSIASMKKKFSKWTTEVEAAKAAKATETDEGDTED